jgi:hypothetical protein
VKGFCRNVVFIGIGLTALPEIMMMFNMRMSVAGILSKLDPCTRWVVVGDGWPIGHGGTSEHVRS